MSIGSLGGVIGSAAGAPLSQTAGSETERAQKESSAHSRTMDANAKAERASGIGQTEQDQESSERDADGRRFWEQPAERRAEEEPSTTNGPAPRQSKDATGASGTHLDLTG